MPAWVGTLKTWKWLVSVEREHRGQAQGIGTGGRCRGQVQGAGTGSPATPPYVHLQKLHTVLFWRLHFGASGLRRHPYKSERFGTVPKSRGDPWTEDRSQSILRLSTWERTISALIKIGSNRYHHRASPGGDTAISYLRHCCLPGCCPLQKPQPQP